MTTKPTSFAILGAGLMGRLLAVSLARAGHQVDIYDLGGPEGEHSAARVAGGMLAPLAESAVTEHGVVRMGRYALARWRELLGTLASPVFFQQEGTLIVWHRQDATDAARLRQQLAATREQVPELPAMEPLDAARLAEVTARAGDTVPGSGAAQGALEVQKAMAARG